MMMFGAWRGWNATQQETPHADLRIDLHLIDPVI
jgi:hypothetical protein